MSSSSTPVPARNSLCTCGSGKKYKHCCGAGREPVATIETSPAGQPKKSSAKLVVGTTITLVTVAIAVMVLVTNRRQGAPAPIVTADPNAAPVAIGLPGGATPAPWYYDTTLNRHWDPTPGHNHWHNGPPPVVAGLPVNTAVATAATPTPWFHDVVNNRHWDPTPGHNHWHDGPPPAPADRK
ncbi:MAG TPA: SEC-C metal-binding domain-containing protein [Opitutaceae bacterium]